jgi:conjugal transfer pilus assembly protein TraB
MQAQIAAMQAQIAAKGQAQETVPSLPAAPAAPSAPSIYEIGGKGVTAGGTLTPTGESAGIPPPPTPNSNTPGTPGTPPPPKSPNTVVHVNAEAPKGVMQGLGRLGGQPEEQGHLDATVGVNDKNRVYLPAGTIITGATLNGVNVGTGPAAMSNPQIVEVRVKKPAIMPNGYRVNLNNCMIINSGYGNLSSERVYLRPTTLSCVNEQGKVIESTIKGYVVGDDGISGVKGVVVDHQGALIAKGFFAGLFSGLGGAFAPQAVTPLQLNPGSTMQYQYPSGSMLAGNAISGGVSNAAGQIAKFYIEEAKALQPTLQINPGVSVDLILEAGSYVEKKGMTKAQLQKIAWEASAAANPQATPSPQQAAQMQAKQTLSGMGGQPVAAAHPAETTEE